MKVIALCVAILIAVVVAGAHEQNGWTFKQRAHATFPHRAVIAVKGGYNALGACDSALERVSAPGSADFGKHLSERAVRALLADEANVRVVEQWLRDAGVAFRTAPTGDFIEVTDSAAAFERLLDVEMHMYTHPESAVFGVRADRTPRVPAKVLMAIDTLAHVDDALPDLAARKVHKPQIGPMANGQTTPAFLKQYYGIDQNAPGVNAGVFEALGQDFAQSDMDAFAQHFGLQSQRVNVTGPNNGGACAFNLNSCAEFTLDIEYMQGLAQGAGSTAYIVSQSVSDIFVDWANWVAQQGRHVDVWSISYGGVAEDEAPTNKERFSLDMCKVGLMGATVFVSSGDDGVQGAQNCLQQRCEWSSSFPATCPYVVSVGATQGPEFGNQEVVCSSTNQGVITSGSSTSHYYPQPSYQTSQVAAYLQNAPSLPPASNYNAHGRFVPDVAFLGAQFVTIIGGRQVALFGTSASSPSFAAIVAIVNSQRRAAGKSNLGFVNPALYQAPAAAFNDIVSGNNGCCSSSRGGCECGGQGAGFGFSAAPGWDAASGFGSPRFGALSRYLTSL